MKGKSFLSENVTVTRQKLVCDILSYMKLGGITLFVSPSEALTIGQC